MALSILWPQRGKEDANYIYELDFVGTHP
jgi:hypothetical protein